MKKIYTAIAVLGVALQSMGQFCIYKDGKAVYVMRGERPDYVTFERPVVEQTESGLEYLDDYSCLRDYVAESGLNLGVDVDPTSFVRGGNTYVTACLNFNEVSAGYAISMGSCTDNQGEMNFKQLKQFVKKAKSSGVSVFGGDIIKQYNQPTKWLNSLIIDEELAESVEIVDEELDFTTFTSHPYYVMDHIPEYNSEKGLISAYEGVWRQFFVVDNIYTIPGVTYHVTMEIMGDGEGSFPVQARWSWSDDGYESATVNFTEEWQTQTFTFIGNDDGNRSSIIVQPGIVENTVYVRNIKISHYGSNLDSPKVDDLGTLLNTKPLTAEKVEALKGAMQKWVSGLMSATQGSVKAWNVISEPLSGYDNDKDGWYDLTRTSNEYQYYNGLFCWSKYLGDVEFARAAVRMAREEFVNAGGNAEELQLFVNEYGLEYTFDGGKRLSSLLHWIDEWESDGVTHIDGIGAEMLLVFYADVDKQKAQEEAIVNTFQTLAESGKLIRLSGLNMRYVDAGGMYVLSSDVSDEQMTEMAGYYEFVIKKYMDIIPQSQRYGIAFDGLTDNNSNRTVGLWNDEFQRSRVFGAVAEVLGQ